MGHRAFEKQAAHSSRYSRSREDCEHLVEMNQAVDAWSLRPLSGAGAGQCTIAPVASSASGASSGAAQVSLGSVATTLHTDTQSSRAQNGSPAPAECDTACLFCKQDLRGFRGDELD